MSESYCEREFLFLLLLHHCSTTKEVRARTQAGQEHGGRSHGRMLPTGFFPSLFSVTFPIQFTFTYTGMVLLTMGQALLHQTAIKQSRKCLTNLCIANPMGALSQIKSCFSQKVETLCQVDIKLTNILALPNPTYGQPKREACQSQACFSN